MVPQTPIAATLDGLNWLERSLMSREARPSRTLKEFFTKCDKDLTETIEKRTEELSKAVPLIWGSTADDASITAQRVTMVVKFYYKLLESMLKAEQARLKKVN